VQSTGVFFRDHYLFSILVVSHSPACYIDKQSHTHLWISSARYYRIQATSI
jgi:hypothetical protein